MELGTKLKNARINKNITQEDASSTIGVSRQTLSSWENEKTYPDIVSLIKLSDLYSVSLDELLKDNNKPSSYVNHIDKAINIIKNKQKIYKCVEIGIYLILIAVFVFLYWTNSNDSARNEIYITMRSFLIPCTIVIISLLIGVDEAWGNNRWFLILFFGVTLGLADTFTHTFDVFNGRFPIQLIITSLIHPSNYSMGAFLSFIGLGIGALARKFNNNSQESKQE